MGTTAKSHVEKELERQEQKKSQVMSIGGSGGNSLVREISKEEIGRKLDDCSCNDGDDNPW